MRERLHLFLLLLTLLDLAFVHATEVVSGAMLAPLWVLAIASGRLRRLQRFTAYRVFWNLGVLLVFTLLVQHATTTGLLHMLEDGLLLAVLCQVHLLNNVGERQRPDLVFFNSFLIAFITSFFAPDVSWSVLFGLHAFALVVALEVQAVTRRAGDIDRAVLRGILRDSTSRCAAIAAATLLVFVFLPRNFNRQGWLGDAVNLRSPLSTGLAEQIRLDREHQVQLDETVVMRVIPSSGRRADVPSHWRGRAFSTFDGHSWSPQHASILGSRFATDVPWDTGPRGTWQRGAQTRDGELRVRLFDLATGRLPAPLGAASVQLQARGGILIDPKSDGVLAFLRDAEATEAAMDYTVRLAAAPLAARQAQRVRQQLVDLPPEGVPRVVRDLARQLRASLPGDAGLPAIAGRSADWLRDNRRYQLPGGPGFARNFEDFLLGGGAGHCEYFATALALLLRQQDVPCRLVGGYLAQEWEDQAHTMVVRARDAHAWVEVLLPDGSWTTLDATPPGDADALRAASRSWWDESRRDLEQLWNAVVGFDAASRARWLQWLGEGLQGAAEQLWRGWWLAVLGVVALSWGWRRRRMAPPSVRVLHRAARRLGMRWRADETPRELVARAQVECAAAARPRLAQLQRAAAAHEAARYRRGLGDRPVSTSRSDGRASLPMTTSGGVS
ncbi:MAG: DUF3488 domain-containing protein [Planctomycetes bacterium]|nr:DUF3488 domain-containing protein [Planctomycetota bacterium]